MRTFNCVLGASAKKVRLLKILPCYFLPEPEQQEHVSEPPSRNWK